jgi:hypothetical protein
MGQITVKILNTAHFSKNLEIADNNKVETPLL